MGNIGRYIIDWTGNLLKRLNMGKDWGLFILGGNLLGCRSMQIFSKGKWIKLE